jgi:hypothetical protein
LSFFKHRKLDNHFVKIQDHTISGATERAFGMVWFALPPPIDGVEALPSLSITRLKTS